MRLLVDVSLLRRHRDFRVAYAARILSSLGTAVTMVALPAQVYALTGSTLAVGLLGMAEIVPLVAAALVGGAVADRVDRRRVLVGTELAFTAVGLTLVLNAHRGDDALLGVCYAGAALAAVLEGFQRPALESMQQVMVSADELPAANALRTLARSLTMVLGPMLGGVLVATSGFTGAYLLDTATFLLGATGFALVRGRYPARPGAGATDTWGDVRAGWQYARHRKDLLGSYAVDVNAMVFGMPIALFPAIAADLGGNWTLGLLYAAPAVGAVVASLLGGVVDANPRHGLGLLWSAGGWGLAITVFGVVDALPLALGLLALAGAADGLSGLYRMAIWNQSIPNELRGRMAGIELLSYSVGPTLGNLEAGLVAAVTSVRTAVVSGGLLCIAGTGALALALPALGAYRAPGYRIAPGALDPGG